MGLNRTHGFAVLGVCVFAVCLFATGLRLPGDERAALRSELATLLAADRHLAPRLSVIDEHRPCAPASGTGLSCRPVPPPGSPGFVEAARLVRETSTAATSKDAEGLHLAGLALLATGDFASAAAKLVAALEIEPTREGIATDLLAAHLMRFESDRDPRALFEGLAALGDRQFEASLSAPLLFNLALLLERSGLPAEAEDLWGRVVLLERDPRWREEARARRDALRLAPAAEWPAIRMAMATGDLRKVDFAGHLQPARLLIEDELLGRWAESELSGDGSSGDSLRRLHRYAEALASAQGDPLVLDALVRAAEPSARRTLAEAHLQYALGRQAHESQEYDRAAPHFRRAMRGFRSAGSPFELWPRFYLAVILHHQPDFRGAQREFLEMQRDPRLQRYPIAAAYVDWMLGLGASRMADDQRAEEHLRAARDRFARAHELENVTAMESMLGGLMERIGSAERAWAHYHAGLEKMPWILKPRRRQNLLLASAEFLHRQGADAAASLYFGSAVREAKASGVALGIALTLQQRSRFSSAIGRPAEASRDLDEALAAAGAIPDPGLRSDTELYLMRARADQLQRDEPAAALALLTDAIDRAHAHDAELGLVSALAARAQVRLALRDRDGAVGDLEAALLEIERQRWRLEDPVERQAFLGQAREILEQLVRLEWAEERFASALHWVERFRARVLGESLGLAIGASPRQADAVSAADVTRGTVVHAFLLTRREIFIWRLSRDGLQVARRSLAEERDVGSMVAAWRRSLQAGEERVAIAERLSRLLLPRELPLPASERMVFVPDSTLDGLPFAALPLADGSRLVEHASVVVAPSIAAFLHLSATADGRRTDGAGLLVVSGVEHDPLAFPELAKLPSRWPPSGQPWPHDARYLGGAAATPDAFLDEARTATVLHFAGHAVGETAQRPAGIVLAPGVGDDGLLSIEELRGLAPTRLRLAILAACGTADGRSTALDGPRSIVQQFLAAGVGSVVGTLWEVEDRTAAEFFEQFLALRDQPDPIHAAQLAMLRSRPGDGTWAAFQLFGTGWSAVSVEKSLAVRPSS